jgi:hypothetical protein
MISFHMIARCFGEKCSSVFDCIFVLANGQGNQKLPNESGANKVTPIL